MSQEKMYEAITFLGGEPSGSTPSKPDPAPYTEAIHFLNGEPCDDFPPKVVHTPSTEPIRIPNRVSRHQEASSRPVPAHSASSLLGNHSQQSPQAQPYQGNCFVPKRQTVDQTLEDIVNSDAIKSYRKEMMRYADRSLLEGPDGSIQLCSRNSRNSVLTPFSPCKHFQAQKQVQYDSGEEEIVYSFTDATGHSVRYATNAKLNDRAQYKALKDHGFVVLANLSASTCAELISRYTAYMISSLPVLTAYSPGWYFTGKEWGFQSSESIAMDYSLFGGATSYAPDVALYHIIFIFAAIQPRLPLKMWIRHPFVLLTQGRFYPTDLSIDDKPRAFRETLERLRYQPVIRILGENSCCNDSASSYRQKENYKTLLSASQQNKAHPVYMVIAQELTPMQCSFCLPIQKVACAERSSDVNVSNLVALILANPDEFETRIERHFSAVFNALGDDCIVQQEIAALTAVSSIVVWFYSIHDPKYVRLIAKTYSESLTLYTRYWEELSDDNILGKFKMVLYNSRRSESFRLRPIEDVDSSFDPENEMLYDETYFYTSSKLLSRLIEIGLRSHMPSVVLDRLKMAGVLSGSVVKTLTFAPNESKDFRFRKLLRNSLRQPGCRDLVEI